MSVNFISRIAYAFIAFAILLALWFLFFGGYFSGDVTHPDTHKPIEIQPFISGLVMPLLTLGSTLLVIASLQSNTIQNFSNNFFKLIDQHLKLLENISSSVEGISSFEEPSKGRGFFDDLANRIATDFATLAAPTDVDKEHSNQDPQAEIDPRLKQNAIGKQGKELLLIIYDHYFHIHQSDLGHYFRHLYHIVNFVEKADIGTEQKKTYIKILRAQLSNYELLLLAYNALHSYGSDKFYPLIEKYQLLKNLNNEQRVPEGYEKRIVDIKILTENYAHLNQQWTKDPIEQNDR